MPRFLPILALLAGPVLGLQAQEYQTTLHPGDLDDFCNFGYWMDIDGDVAIIGANDKAYNGMNYAGAAYIFRKVGGNWVEEAKLMAPAPEIHDNFGAVVAIDGNLAVVGAPDFAFSSFSGTGRAWVFRRVAGVWTLEAVLVPSNGGWDNTCAGRVDISGSTIVVSNAYRDSVSIFDHVGGNWIETATLNPTTGPYSYSDWLQLQGNTLIVAEPWATVNGLLQAGLVHVYQRSGNNWIETQTLTDPIPDDEDYFGSYLALDGDVLAVGVPSDNWENIMDSGKIQVFRRNAAGNFVFETSLQSSNPTGGAHFGKRIGVSGDRIVTASEYDGAPGSYFDGAAYLFEWNGVDWVGGQPFHLLPLQGNQGYGYSCAIGGTDAFVSNREDFGGFANVGGVQVWDLTAGMRLGVDPVLPESGNDATFTLKRGQPNQAAWLAYSLAGPGNFFVPPLGVSLNLANPSQAGPSLTTDAQGQASWTLFLPPAAFNLRVWFQAVQVGQASNYFGANIR